MRRFKMAAFLAALLLIIPAFALAGNVATVCWQLAPYNDVVCFDIDSRGFSMSAIGWDHAPGSYKYPAYGAICPDDYYWVYSFGWTVCLLNFAADIDPGTFDGVWYDFTGDYGDFLFLGPGPQVDGIVEGKGPKFKNQ